MVMVGGTAAQVPERDHVMSSLIPWNKTLLNLDDKADHARIQVKTNEHHVSIARIEGTNVTDAIIVPRAMARRIALAILKETDGGK